MALARGSRTKDQNKIKPRQNGGIGFDSDTILVIRLPDRRMLRVLSQSVLLAMVLLALHFIGSISREFSSDSHSELSSYGFGSDLIDAEFLDVLLQDLAIEGLIKKGDKALIVTCGTGDVIINLRFLNANAVELVLKSDLEQESLLPNGTFDFALSLGPKDVRSVDRVMKVGGVVVSQLDHFNAPGKQPTNYRVVYLRRYESATQPNYRIMYLPLYESTIVAMKKTSLLDQHRQVESSTKRRLFQLEFKTKRIALQGLEDVLLEPPRKVSAKSRKSLNRFNYLPDLLGDSLEGYPRRVFVDVSSQEDKNSAITWFKKNYPTRNQEFELYNIVADFDVGFSRGAMPSVDAPNWLIKNVREDDFVVMKAEAEEVLDMLKTKSVGLVDELFLECGNPWQNRKRKNIKRAYWECLALYGRVRDEGVAVHQWWG